MRKAVLSAAIAATVLFVAGMAIHTLQLATASSSSKAGHQAADIVNVRALENKLDIKGLPVMDVEGGED
jgi:hypothetical protein